MLRTDDAIIEAMRVRKEALGLSNAVLDELAGMTPGYWDKIAGPTRVKTPSLFSLMAFAGALGWAVQFVDDPDRRMSGRWDKRTPQRAHERTVVSKEAMRKAKPLVLAELSRKGGLSWWAGKSPQERRAHIAKLDSARAAKRQAGLNEAA